MDTEGALAIFVGTVFLQYIFKIGTIIFDLTNCTVEIVGSALVHRAFGKEDVHRAGKSFCTTE